MILLGDLTGKLEGRSQELPDDVVRQFESIATALVAQSAGTGSAVLSSDHLLKILDVFRGGRRLEVCKEILLKFRSHPATNDAALINTVLEIGRILHDSVDSLSAVGEKRQIALLIGGFIDKIDFGRDLEQVEGTGY